ncbi:MAG TPA: hypothetical protein VM345_07385 [Acidimicrobiales bacterium]|jgi:hypothetical protein|nr:hypothetical protein [Acidimicrobiales bacterium]
MAANHVIYEPEWMIDERGNGSFRIECQCGWERKGFDTASKARAAAFDHSASGAALLPDKAPEDAQRRRFWHRK